MRLNNIVISCICFTNIFASDFHNNINYFGNLTGSFLDNNDYYIKNYHANSVTSDLKLSPYSKFGLQSTLYNDDITFVVQTVLNSRDNKNSDVTPELTWLNAKYKFNDNTSIKAGRIQTGVFLNADSQDVNYLHNWAKDKNIVYELVPMKFYDGIELKYSYDFDDYICTTTIIPYGKTNTNVYEFVENGNLNVDDIKIISFNIANDDLRFKVSYLDGYFTINIDDPNYKLLMQNLAQGGYDISRYNYTNKYYKQYNFGFEYNISDFTITTEYLQLEDSHSLFAKTKAFYTMLAYNYNDLTPYIMYSQNKNDKSHFDTNNINSTELEVLLYTTNSSEKTITLGMRYEITMGVALKFQFDRISTTDYGINYNAVVDREGYVSRYANTQEKPIYQTTFGISFAF